MANEPGEPNEVDDNGKPQPLQAHCCALGAKHFYRFVPQPGITVDELTASVPLMIFGIGRMIKSQFAQACDLAYEAMDEQTRRHWEVGTVSKVAVAQKPNRLQLPPGAIG